MHISQVVQLLLFIIGQTHVGIFLVDLLWEKRFPFVYVLMLVLHLTYMQTFGLVHLIRMGLIDEDPELFESQVFPGIWDVFCHQCRREGKQWKGI